MRVLWLSALVIACGGRTDVGGFADESEGGTSSGGHSTTGGKHSNGGAHAGGAHAGGAPGVGGAPITVGGAITSGGTFTSGGSFSNGGAVTTGGTFASGGTGGVAFLQAECDKYCVLAGAACPQGVAGSPSECSASCMKRAASVAKPDCLASYDKGLSCSMGALSSVQNNCSVAQQILFKSCQEQLKEMQACGLSLPDDFACDVKSGVNMMNNVMTCTILQQCAAVQYSGFCAEDFSGSMTATCSCSVNGSMAFSYQVPKFGSICATLAVLPCGPSILEPLLRGNGPR
jgi:hypothetical protein